MSGIINTVGKSGVKLREYDNKYYLQATYGEYVSWCKPKVGKSEYAEKDRPIEIQLGDAQTARKVLQEILKEVG